MVSARERRFQLLPSFPIGNVARSHYEANQFGPPPRGWHLARVRPWAVQLTGQSRQVCVFA